MNDAHRGARSYGLRENVEGIDLEASSPHSRPSSSESTALARCDVDETDFRLRPFNVPGGEKRNLARENALHHRPQQQQNEPSLSRALVLVPTASSPFFAQQKHEQAASREPPSVASRTPIPRSNHSLIPEANPSVRGGGVSRRSASSLVGGVHLQPLSSNSVKGTHRGDVVTLHSSDSPTPSTGAAVLPATAGARNHHLGLAPLHLEDRWHRRRVLLDPHVGLPSGHPLVEDRPMLDAWPATGAPKRSSAAKGVQNQIAVPIPELLSTLQATITDELVSLNQRFHQTVSAISAAESTCCLPTDIVGRGDTTTDGADGPPPPHKDPGLTSENGRRMVPESFFNLTPCSDEDAYRLSRARVFTAALYLFADQFRTYRPLLRWIALEVHRFAHYCRLHVWSPEAREKFRAEATELAQRSAEAEKTRLKEALKKVTQERDTYVDTVKTFESKRQILSDQLIDRDRLLLMKDRELTEALDARASLVSKIDALSEELWALKKDQEGPQAKINQLSASVSALEERLKRAAAAVDMLSQEKTNLTDRCNDLDRQLREKKKQVATAALSTAVKAELAALKRREVDLIGLNATVQDKVARAEAKIAELHEVIAILRHSQSDSDTLHVSSPKKSPSLSPGSPTASTTGAGGGTTTPRPVWQEMISEFGLPLHLTSTTRRVASLAAVCRDVTKERDELKRQLESIRVMLGASFRDDRWLTSTDILPSMLAPWVEERFMENGSAGGANVPSVVYSDFHSSGAPRNEDGAILRDADSDVPGPLPKRYTNRKFTRDLTARLCRLWWVERQENYDRLADLASFNALFDENHAPRSKLFSPAEFGANFRAALHWYAYDPMIGLTRQFATGALDHAVFAEIHNYIARLRQALVAYRPYSPPPAAGSPSSEIPAAAQTTVLSKTDAVAAMVACLVDREDDEIKRLIVALNKDCPGRDVSINALFAFDATDCQFTHFLEELYKQLAEDRRWWTQVIADGLRISETDALEGSYVAPNAIASLLFAIDPQIPAVYMDSILTRLYGVSVEDLYPLVIRDAAVKRQGIEGDRKYGCGDVVSAPLSVAYHRLCRMSIQRFSKKSACDQRLLHLGLERAEDLKAAAAALSQNGDNRLPENGSAPAAAVATDSPAGGSGTEVVSLVARQVKPYDFKQYMAASGSGGTTTADTKGGGDASSGHGGGKSTSMRASRSVGGNVGGGGGGGSVKFGSATTVEASPLEASTPIFPLATVGSFSSYASPSGTEFAP